jgi:glycosyltransferase involved in cell wall biosynthesis
MTYYGNPQQRAFREYTQQLAKSGHPVTVIAAGRPEDPFREVDEACVEIFRIPVSSIRKWSLEPISFALRTIQILRRLKDRIDIVHCYTSWEMALVGLYCRAMGIRSCYDIRSGPMTGGWRYSLGAQLQKVIAAIFGICIVISDPLGRTLFESSRASYEVVPIGTDLEKFQPTSSGQKVEVREMLELSESSPLVVYSGIIRNSKGAREVTEVAIETCRRDENTHFLIIGGGKDLEEQKRKVQKMEFTDRICFTGEVPPNQVPYFLGAADIALSYVPNNSQYAPQPPLKTAEYLACELPVVATDTPGQRIYLEHGENGWLVEDDIQVLTDSIVKLLEAPEAMKQFRTSARKSVQSFNWKKIVSEELVPVYRKMVAR